MDWELLMWILSLIICGVLIFCIVFILISFSDLESDYVNPIDLARRVNSIVLPEYILHTTLTIMLLLSGQWVDLLLNLPLLAWNVRSILRGYKLDATKVFGTLSKNKQEGYVKLGYYVVLFFFFLYRFLNYLIQNFLSTTNHQAKPYPKPYY
eukprot:TRINITY_DN2406_c0_g1_i1.p1 TRINITY_DN2406_c0_g1~~TRINITY_DN2406_c0_g1_i1.p1  ORF type:complete len:152 (-),score=2.14 TRINITY_DN2406_c0_g1_i1:23-478(-)